MHLVTLVTFYGWWVFTVPATGLDFQAKFRPSRDAGYSRIGQTGTHEVVRLVEQPDGILLLPLDNNACFRFPRAARSRHPRRLRGVLDLDCDGTRLLPFTAHRRHG